MSGCYKARYGISSRDVTTLIKRFYTRLRDADWESADAWVKWCSENGWQRGRMLFKKDKAKPHGPDNSYFLIPGQSARQLRKEENRRRKEERKTTVSPFCECCTKNCKEAVGCERWRQYFVQNWDQNISIVKPVPKEDPNVTKYFRYEHPDLVREGIVFENRSNNFPGSQ